VRTLNISSSPAFILVTPNFWIMVQDGGALDSIRRRRLKCAHLFLGSKTFVLV